ncbi:MAG: 50S ribosomal protein L17 [Parcubacteria group bacterium RIFOXYD2_FULL_52_8]|nr:MAG: 50S ribosomal protein L17 [Parcubacteria group bacterium RIFOXYD2_FULL_52_8]
MRHHSVNRKFGRETNQRRALMRTLAEGLFTHGKITTTEAKAKSLRPYVEKLITKGRSGTLAARRLVAEHIGTSARATLLFTRVVEKYKERPGGYTRIVKMRARVSDGSPMAIIELI